MSDIRLSAGLHTRLEQRLRLAPQIIQSIEILQLPTVALEELIHQEMTDNPVLEMRQIEPPEPPQDGQEAPDEPAEGSDGADDDRDPIEIEVQEDWREFFGERPTRQGAEASDRKQEAMLNTAARPATLQESLLAQFRLLESSEAVSAAATDIIYNFDDAGYLQYPLGDLVAGAKERYSLAQAQEALRLVQSLEPAGIGARDLRECLLLQLPLGENDLAREIIEQHLEDVEQNRLPRIAQKTGYSVEEVKAAVEYISRLNPRPGASFGGETAPGIVPDVIVDYTDKGYEVRLEDDHVPNLFISKLYEQLAGSPDAPEQTKKYLRDKIRSARWLIDAIEQRRTTLFRISRSIVDLQTEFLDFGLSHLRPLRMQEVADKVAVHVSTVSRAIADKYIQTPRGIFPMKYFFTGGVSNDSGEMQTWRTIQQEIKDVVDKEDRASPLSDEDIAAMLSQKGSHVARRTVTKYRKALGIASSRRRKAY
jgi:RNA polymerase sigma-54 factor